MEKIVVEIEKDLWGMLLDAYEFVQQDFLKANIDFTIKEVKIEDDFFKEDTMHASLKKQANKAYRELREYEFNKRNNGVNRKNN